MTMMSDNVIMAIDPGTTESAYVLYDLDKSEIVRNVDMCDGLGKIDNQELLELIKYLLHNQIISNLFIEMIASYGATVGATTFETVLWIGRFLEAFGVKDMFQHLVYRKQRNKITGCDSVCMSLCKENTRVNDAQIKQRLKDIFPNTGGGSTPAVGTKKQPGPLYGGVKDIWSALAVAVTVQLWLKEVANEGEAATGREEV